MTNLQDYSGDDEIITSHEMQVIIDSKPKAAGFKTNINTLDKVIDLFEEGQLIALSGPRKNGKTLLAQTFTDSFSKEQVGTLWFSYELTTSQFLESFPKVPFFYMPKTLKRNSMDWLRERIQESILKFNIKVVIIDHLHYLFDMGGNNSPSIEIGRIIRVLKGMCVDYKIVIFLLCHLEKWDHKKGEPSDTNIRDSSFIAQESDTGLILWRDPKHDGIAYLKVCYCRKTGVMDKKIKLCKVNGLLKESI